MILKSISFYHFRNFKDSRFRINPKLTAIFGDNAKGKTSLLEGIYFILKGEGFRESQEEELIIFNESSGFVEANLEDPISKERRGLRIDLTKKDFSLNKTYFLEKTRKGRHSYVKDLFPVVLFSPEQIEIIDRTMSFRREYFDDLLSSVDSEYKKRLHNYQQAIRRRNKILEFQHNSANIGTELEFWNKYLIEQGTYLIDKRKVYIKYLNSHNKIDSKEFFVEYKFSPITLERFNEYLQKELLVRKTMIGPHKDDYHIFMITKGLPKKNVHLYGSRSEQRLALFWLKMNELKYFESAFKKKPILLLDDIFSELDKTNQKLIFNLIGDYQTVITSTEKELIKLVDFPDHSSYDTIDL